MTCRYSSFPHSCTLTTDSRLSLSCVHNLSMCQLSSLPSPGDAVHVNTRLNALHSQPAIHSTHIYEYVGRVCSAPTIDIRSAQKHSDTNALVQASRCAIFLDMQASLSKEHTVYHLAESHERVYIVSMLFVVRLISQMYCVLHHTHRCSINSYVECVGDAHVRYVRAHEVCGDE